MVWCLCVSVCVCVSNRLSHVVFTRGRYLSIVAADGVVPPAHVAVKSNLPIGAGLGSSAAYVTRLTPPHGTGHGTAHDRATWLVALLWSGPAALAPSVSSGQRVGGSCGGGGGTLAVCLGFVGNEAR